MLSSNRIGLVVVAVVPWQKIISNCSLLPSPPSRITTQSLFSPVVSFSSVRSPVRIGASFNCGHSFLSLPSSSSSNSIFRVVSLVSFRRPGLRHQHRKPNNRSRLQVKFFSVNSAPRISTSLKSGASRYASSAALSSSLCSSSVMLKSPGMGQEQQQQRSRRNRGSQQMRSLCIETIASTDDPTAKLNSKKQLHEELHRYGVHESDYTANHKVEPQESEFSLDMEEQNATNIRKPRKRKANPNLTSGSKQQQHLPPKGKSRVVQDWCCYLLLSVDSKKTYVGVTYDITRRLRQHNGEIAGGAKSARAGRPWRLVCTVRGFHSRSEACQFEWRWKSRTAKIKTIVQQDSETVESPLIIRRRSTLAKTLESKEWSFLNVQWHVD